MPQRSPGPCLLPCDLPAPVPVPRGRTTLAGVCLVAHRACRRAVLFQLNGYGLDWTVHTFEKPWFTTFESALACWVTLALFALANLARRCWGRARQRQAARVRRAVANGNTAYQPLLGEPDAERGDKAVSACTHMRAVPAACACPPGASLYGA